MALESVAVINHHPRRMNLRSTTDHEPASDAAIKAAAACIASAEGLLVTAGAGMSVDSGLPDFRSREGFWRAYPPLRELGLSFEEMAQPHWFESAPEMAWAWYGHRRQLYRDAVPHAGYGLLHRWGKAMPAGFFVITSNVDGQFHKAGVDPVRILEFHGAIDHLQCTVPCSEAIWQEDLPDLAIDLATLRAEGRLPRCRSCGALARPNVLMFDDATWVRARKAAQEARCAAWLEGIRGKRFAIVECGAGTAISTIRRIGEGLAESLSATLIRINPALADEGLGEGAAITIRLPALRALAAVGEALPVELGGKAAKAT